MLFVGQEAVTMARAEGRDSFITLSHDGTHFALSDSGAAFDPWGFNYDRDASSRLLEDYWFKDWSAVAKHFREMKALGANAARIHLQLASFMQSAEEPNRRSLAQLARLLRLAEKTKLYLDITGLGCYRAKDVPEWYDSLDESRRWQVQARFWEAVAATCSQSPAVFCYDLMNEPIISGNVTNREWTAGELGGYRYAQRLTLDLAGRTEKQVAAAWVQQMVAAIRARDRRHLVTVGVIPWALVFPGAQPLFYSKEADKELDFVSVHFYPEKGKVQKALAALAVYDIGKPLVIEETYPLSCSIEEENQFLDGSRGMACGWFSFYWGETKEHSRQKQKGDDRVQAWVQTFARKGREFKAPLSK